jgi:hypothetical protein
MRGSNGGPKSKAGKAAVSRNPLKHGIMSPHPVIIEGIETEAAWQRFRDGIVEAWAPEDPLEEDLAESIALLRWRLKHVTHYETAILNHQVIKTETDLATADAYLDGTLSTGELPELDPAYVAAHQQTRVIPYGDALDKITRYEAHLHRLWVQTSHELEARQARRRGERTHLARLDISSPPAG